MGLMPLIGVIATTWVAVAAVVVALCVTARRGDEGLALDLLAFRDAPAHPVPPFVASVREPAAEAPARGALSRPRSRTGL